MSRDDRFSIADEEAGGRESYEDADLYDFEYRRRRLDVAFYRRLVRDQAQCGPQGPLVELACGTGRLLIPLVRDGRTVIGIDRSAAMLARAAKRRQRLAASARSRLTLVRADLRAFSLRPQFAMAICAFHSLQHLIADADVIRLFRTVKRALLPGGWFAFDVLPPDPRWIGRDPKKRWSRTYFRHPATGERMVYTTNHSYDHARRALHMRLHYQPVDDEGRPTGPESVQRLCHRQFHAPELAKLLERAGFRVLATFGGFDGRPIPDGDEALYTDEYIFVARNTT